MREINGQLCIILYVIYWVIQIIIRAPKSRPLLIYKNNNLINLFMASKLKFLYFKFVQYALKFKTFPTGS